MDLGFSSFQLVDKVTNNIIKANLLTDKEANDFKKLWLKKLVEKNLGQDSEDKIYTLSEQKDENDEYNIPVDDCLEKDIQVDNYIYCSVSKVFGQMIYYLRFLVIHRSSFITCMMEWAL